jgi:hypothetical protein
MRKSRTLQFELEIAFYSEFAQHTIVRSSSEYDHRPPRFNPVKVVRPLTECSFSRNLCLQNNTLGYLGPIFDDLEGGGSVRIDFSYNQLTEQALTAALGSFTNSKGLLQLNFSGNRITRLPPNMVAGLADLAHSPANVAIWMQSNPIVGIDPTAFSGAPMRVANIQSLTLDMSNPTNGTLRVPASLAFELVNWGLSQDVRYALAPAKLSLLLGNTGVDMSIVGMLGHVQNAPPELNIDLSGNGYTIVPPGMFRFSRATSINMSHNNITHIASDAFKYNLDLQSLDVRHNQLTVINAVLMSNTPTVSSLFTGTNYIWALPLTNNHIAHASDATENQIACSSYGPNVTNCTCTAPLHLSTHCGYIRCMPSEDGCPVDQLFNSSDCSMSPRSACVVPSQVSPQLFYSQSLQLFLPVTNCTSAYARSHGNGFRSAYQ